MQGWVKAMATALAAVVLALVAYRFQPFTGSFVLVLAVALAVAAGVLLASRRPA